MSPRLEKPKKKISEIDDCLAKGIIVYSEQLEIAVTIAKEAGELIIRQFGKARKSYKLDGSIVTEADIESDDLIKKVLTNEFPDHSVYSEESEKIIRNSDHLWVVDPLDGTTNFSVKNPYFAVSIAYYFKDILRIGVVFAPILNEMFIAEEKAGATLNGSPVAVDTESSLEDAFISFENGRDPTSRRNMVRIYSKLKPINNKIRQVGAVSLDLCNVATGRYGAFIMPGSNIWDIAAGRLVVEEAGGIVTDFKNQTLTDKSSSILAASPSIHERLCEIISSYNGNNK
ncbi:MAG: inositol monophosphatase family protein [Candidatus Thorarchaeota archaeon]